MLLPLAPTQLDSLCSIPQNTASFATARLCRYFCSGGSHLPGEENVLLQGQTSRGPGSRTWVKDSGISSQHSLSMIKKKSWLTNVLSLTNALSFRTIKRPQPTQRTVHCANADFRAKKACLVPKQQKSPNVTATELVLTTLLPFQTLHRAEKLSISR